MSDAGSPHRILRSILQPSLEVDPQFFPRMLITDDGRVFTESCFVMVVGGTRFTDNTGRERVFKTAQIVERKPLTTSMMPEGLVDTMTDRELRDLIAFMNATPNRVPGKSKKDKALSALSPERAAPFLGTWFLDFKDGYGGWVEIAQGEQNLAAQLMWRVGSPKPVQRISFSGESMVLTRIRKTKSTNFIVTVDKGVITVTSETTGEIGQDADVLPQNAPISPRCDSENRFHCSTVRIYRAGDSNHQLPKTAARREW